MELLETKLAVNKSILETTVFSIVSGLLFYLFLITYQPFGASDYQHQFKFLMLSPFALTIFFSALFVGLILHKISKGWTLGLELINTILILLFSSLLSYLFNSLFWDNSYLTLGNLVKQLVYNSAIGIPVILLVVLAREAYYKTNFTNEHEIIKEEKDNIFDQEKQLIEPALLKIIPEYSDLKITISIDDFLYAEAADNYCIIHYLQKNELQSQMIRLSLTRLLSQIECSSIRRVHRSYIVNFTKISKRKGNSSGYSLSLNDVATKIPVSRTYAHLIKNYF